MKTEELIDLLAQDTAPAFAFRTLFLAATLAGVAIAGLVFSTAIGVRPDFERALRTGRFLFKFVITVPLALGTVGLLLSLARPGADIGLWRWRVLASPALLLGAVASELWLLPSATWRGQMIGHNGRLCLTLIPLLSLGPLACLLAVLRRGAPAHPGRAGVAAGLTAAAIAATFYAANCDDDSPLFVAFWYPMAFAVMAAAGYGLGQRLLRW
ncbi:NrsF family protein [Ancylobacter mangrovi]|uniref:NrsF family protein n=1 Tax=Ancylobacter mangrovi TaxID=2972472 RepID=UPI0021623B2F|nr:NrsF family protein [Ancylobacter mangrovi]MCS0503612.1 NrsF family protein [Ancylobacter mangrovi]